MEHRGIVEWINVRTLGLQLWEPGFESHAVMVGSCREYMRPLYKLASLGADTWPLIVLHAEAQQSSKNTNI